MGKTKAKKMREHASDLADKAGPLLADARDKAGPLLADARDKAGPVLSDAREMAAPIVADAKDRFHSDVLPVLTAALAAASEATEEVRGEAKKRGLATAAALKGEVEAPKDKHRLRKLLIVLGLGGVAAAVAKKMSDRKPSTAWQSSYTPPPAPAAPAPGPAAPRHSDATPTATAAAAAAAAGSSDDEAAAAPDEAAADAAERPHAATTPDDPAEETQVKKD